MDRAIFDLKASVEATSLYILLCALTDENQAVTLKSARSRWNSEEDGLFRAAEELLDRRVVEGKKPLTEDTPLHINPADRWS